MVPTPSRALRLAVEAAKVAVVGVIAVVAVTPALQTTPVTAPAGPAPSDRAEDARVAALMERHDCSVRGLGPGVIPGSALVERDDRVRQVSFDDGWAVFTGDADGRLVAVCRADLARRGGAPRT